MGELENQSCRIMANLHTTWHTKLVFIQREIIIYKEKDILTIYFEWACGAL